MSAAQCLILLDVGAVFPCHCALICHDYRRIYKGNTGATSSQYDKETTGANPPSCRGSRVWVAPDWRRPLYRGLVHANMCRSGRWESEIDKAPWLCSQGQCHPRRHVLSQPCLSPLYGILTLIPTLTHSCAHSRIPAPAERAACIALLTQDELDSSLLSAGRGKGTSLPVLMTRGG